MINSIQSLVHDSDSAITNKEDFLVILERFSSNSETFTSLNNSWYYLHNDIFGMFKSSIQPHANVLSSVKGLNVMTHLCTKPSMSRAYLR